MRKLGDLLLKVGFLGKIFIVYPILLMGMLCAPLGPGLKSRVEVMSSWCFQGTPINLGLPRKFVFWYD